MAPMLPLSPHNSLHNLSLGFLVLIWFSVIMINCSHLNPQYKISQVATLTDPRHICTIMAAVSESVNNLQELNLSGNDLSKVVCI